MLRGKTRSYAKNVAGATAKHETRIRLCGGKPYGNDANEPELVA